MSLFKFLFVILKIITIKTAILNECHHDIYPDGNIDDIVVCTNNCDECNIICDRKDQCKGNVKVYSGAIITNIRCTNENSCEGLGVYLGSSDNYSPPFPYSKNNFVGTYSSAYIDCTGNIACKVSSFHITGDYINGASIDVSGDGDNFQDSRLECNLFEHESCQCTCGSSNLACSNALFECYGGTCECVGVGCNSLQTGHVVVRS